MSLTKDQEGGLNLLVDNDSVSIKSGHGVGKSTDAAVAALWFKYTHWPSIVITTAPTERQVKEVLWREIRNRKAQAIYPLEGKPLTMKLDLGPIDYMLGFSTNDVQQLQGFHSPNIMVIIDEANGYPDELFDAIEGLISGGARRILFMIGNPIVPSGKFFNSFSDGITATKTISCLDHPNVKSGKNLIPGAVTKEWVDKMRRLWGEDSAFWQSRVLGEFPKSAIDVVIYLWWIEKACAYKFTTKDKNDEGAPYMGHDPAEYGSDDYVWHVGTKRRTLKVVSKRNIEPAEAIGTTKLLKRQFRVPDENITIDGIGSGATIYSVLRADKIKCNRFVASERAIDNKTFEDKTAEAWFNTRNVLNPDAELYEGFWMRGESADRIKADLCTRTFQTSRHGRLQMQPKEQFRKKRKRSPNFGDAFSITYYPLVKKTTYSLVFLPDVISND